MKFDLTPEDAKYLLSLLDKDQQDNPPQLQLGAAGRARLALLLDTALYQHEQQERENRLTYTRT